MSALAGVATIVLGLAYLVIRYGRNRNERRSYEAWADGSDRVRCTRCGRVDSIDMFDCGGLSDEDIRNGYLICNTCNCMTRCEYVT